MFQPQPDSEKEGGWQALLPQVVGGGLILPQASPRAKRIAGGVDDFSVPSRERKPGRP